MIAVSLSTGYVCSLEIACSYRNIAMYHPHSQSFLHSRVAKLVVKAKMGMMEDFEASLQVLRGFDTDITVEVKCYAKEKIMTIPRKEKKRKARREEKAEKAAVLNMVFRRCTGREDLIQQNKIFWTSYICVIYCYGYYLVL
ncbi:hypothetical protein ZIOFF_032579 [Zingiber officinale]|uniref:Uncharacterized protein n=1 Tax=Zingiber officinale TaxID=94328 RepID=A0A8J5GIK2_ZINOF|nr:hypothetical protein ZIOFF_032579 [Zingiber officinale]